MKKKQKNNPILLTGQDSNMKIVEEKVTVASIYDSTETLQIVLDNFKRKDKMITINFGPIMSPSWSVQISAKNFIEKFAPEEKDLPF